MSLVRLDGGPATLLIDARGPGVPRIVHWGARLPAATDLVALADLAARPLPNNALDEDCPPTMLPEQGFGWFGQPGLAGGRGGKDWASRLRLAQIEGGEGEVEIRLADGEAGLEVTLSLSMDPEGGLLEATAEITNLAKTPYQLDRLASVVLPVPERAREALVFDGQWNLEFQERRVALGMGVLERENRRGRTSSDAWPAIIVGEEGFSNGRGAVWGLHLGWSGNHRIAVEGTVEATRLLHAGELLMPGEVVLAPDEAYETPVAYAAFSPDGLDGLSAIFHGFVRRWLVNWPDGKMTPRPVHLNTWEAVYFRHELGRLKALADRAAALGVERFVLDDGWFSGRNDDTSSLGDWVPDPLKYPDGLGPLITHVKGLGMQFGLWVEPEMVNPDSALYGIHPDWVLNLDPHPRPTGRHQLVLDLTREDAFTYILHALDRLLTQNEIDYLKWDMNRDLAPAGSGGAAAYAGQVRAVWRLIDVLRGVHPRVEIESCSSGGARVDFGILRHVHRFWPSDCNDALDRQRIHAGFLRFVPPEMMGAHVGPSPCHTTGRRLTMSFRAATAIFGHMGLELDVTALAEGEAEELAAFIALYKRHRSLVHGGRLVRLDGLEPGRIGYGVVAGDGSEALFAIVQTASSHFRIPPPVLLPGLAADRTWRVRFAAPPPAGTRLKTDAARAMAAGGIDVPGATLALTGLQLPRLWPESALLLHCS